MQSNSGKGRRGMTPKNEKINLAFCYSLILKVDKVKILTRLGIEGTVGVFQKDIFIFSGSARRSLLSC